MSESSKKRFSEKQNKNKSKILSSLTHPHVVTVRLSDILKNVGNQTINRAPLTSIVFFFLHTMEVNRAHQLFSNPYSSKYLLLCLTEKKFIKVWNDLRVSK